MGDHTIIYLENDVNEGMNKNVEINQSVIIFKDNIHICKRISFKIYPQKEVKILSRKYLRQRSNIYINMYLIYGFNQCSDSICMRNN